MKVYKIKADFRFQCFFPSDPNVEGSGDELIRTDIAHGRGVEKASIWTPPRIYVDKPERERGNFIHVWGLQDFAVDMKTCVVLKSIFDETCELLPFLPLDGQQYYRLNILRTVDCLDQEKTKWRTTSNGKRLAQIEEFHFDPNRFARYTLFKLPKQAGLMTVVGLVGPAPEFKALVESGGLTGLTFEEVWSDVGLPIRPSTASAPHIRPIQHGGEACKGYLKG